MLSAIYGLAVAAIGARRVCARFDLIGHHQIFVDLESLSMQGRRFAVLPARVQDAIERVTSAAGSIRMAWSDLPVSAIVKNIGVAKRALRFIVQDLR